MATSRALAAQSQNQLAVDRELSILLAMRAVRMSPTPDACLRYQRRLTARRYGAPSSPRLRLRCQLQNGPSLAYNPSVGLAEALCGGTRDPADRHLEGAFSYSIQGMATP